MIAKSKQWGLAAMLFAATTLFAGSEQPTMKPDYAKLQLKGNMMSGHRQDSFVLAVQAAARLWGKETDYDTLTCLAGNAFAPLRNLAEDCTSHCQLEAVYSDRAMATVAGFVGLRARKLDLPAVQGFDVTDAERPAYLRQVATMVRAAMDAGEVLIALQGWKVKGGPHGFTHWGYAGIVTAADPANGNILGAHLNGHKDNPIYHGAVMWAVAPAEVTLPSPAAEQVMLRQAVDYIRGQGLFAPKPPVVYGLAALEAWIKHMQEVKGYCAPCYGRGQPSWHDAMENGERLLGGARIAARKLRSLGPQYEAAAKHYDRIVELLKPVKYQEFIGDLDKQKAHAATVLVPVRAELAAAAAEIEKAWLPQPAKAPSKVLLQPVSDAYDAAVKARRSMNHARSELVCRLALLHAQGAKDVTYEDLVVTAGWGTSFVFHPKKSWLIFALPDDPKETEERLAQVSGWRWQSLGNCKGKPEEAWAALTKSLDAGRGVVGAWLDDYVFAGYEAAARKEDRKVYHLGGWDPNGWWRWAEFEKWCTDWGRLSGYVEQAPPGDERAGLLNAMRHVVKFATGDGRRSVPKLAAGSYGLAGMEIYAKAVADTAQDPDQFEGGWLGCYCINRQHYAREAAARWFRARSELLAQPAREHLLKAVAHYEAACAAWKEFEAVLGRGTGKTKLDDLKVLWRDPAARHTGAAAIRKAAESERRAVAEIESALEQP